MTDVTVTVTWGTNSQNSFSVPYTGNQLGWALNVSDGGPNNFSVGSASPVAPALNTYSLKAIEALSTSGVFIVIAEGLAPQNLFQSVSFTDFGATPQSFTSASATLDTTTFTGFTVWKWVSATNGPNGAVVFHNVTTPPVLTLDAPTLVDGSGVLLEWTPSSLGGLTVESFDVFRNGDNVASDLEGDVFTYADQTDSFETSFTYFIRMHLSDGSVVDSNTETITTGTETAEFNCNCETVSAYSTLAQLRVRMAIQCGYAAMSANLPAGQIAEFNEYMLSAQKQLYYKFRAQRTERLFKWVMVPGQRYYAIADSEDESEGCTLKLDPLAVTWVGFEDENRAWYRLIEGIDPVYYTRANINFGWPTRYEIRSCIEVFPAPQAAYSLWIKGDIGLAPFTADADRPTFDDEAVLLFAIANWKSAKGRQDADRCMGQATQRIQDLTARKHGTTRYVPSAYVQNPETPPKFLPLGSQQS